MSSGVHATATAVNTQRMAFRTPVMTVVNSLVPDSCTNSPISNTSATTPASDPSATLATPSAAPGRSISRLCRASDACSLRSVHSRSNSWLPLASAALIWRR